MIRAGRLDRRIRLMEPTVVKDSEFGGATDSFTLLAEVWAQAIPARGDEREAGDDASVEIDERMAWRIRWRPGLSRLLQIEWDGRWFVITSIREIARRREVIIEAVERGAE